MAALKNIGLWLIGKRQSPFSVDVVAPEALQSAKEDIYAAMTAGGFNIPKDANYEKTAYWLAREALDTDNVSQICAQKAGYAFYLAIPSLAMSSSGRFKTPLAAALPSHPDHKGNGAYTLRFPDSNFAVAVLKTDNDLRIIANEITPVFEALEDTRLDIFDCANFAPHELVSLSLAAQESAAVVGRVIASTSMVVLICTAILYLITNMIIGWTGSTVLKKIEAREAQMEQVVREVSLVSPLSRNLASLSKITASVARAGGWIKSYQIDASGNEYFEVELPEWVSRDYVESLGAGVKVDIDRVRRVLIAIKGKKGDQKEEANSDSKQSGEKK